MGIKFKQNQKLVIMIQFLEFLRKSKFSIKCIKTLKSLEVIVVKENLVSEVIVILATLLQQDKNNIERLAPVIQIK
jgi:hypothetical protein